VLALTALRSDGTLVPEKIRDLMQIFRPNHKGCLTLVDFCKSVDSLYKELRLLRASVRNSQKIDQSFERIFNVVFYTILICVCLALLGFDPLALFLSLSSFALAFSFMISRASSTYFDVRSKSPSYEARVLTIYILFDLPVSRLFHRVFFSFSVDALTISEIAL